MAVAMVEGSAVAGTYSSQSPTKIPEFLCCAVGYPLSPHPCSDVGLAACLLRKALDGEDSLQLGLPPRTPRYQVPNLRVLPESRDPPKPQPQRAPNSCIGHGMLNGPLLGAGWVGGGLQ